MHTPFSRRGVGQAGLLKNRQGIHVGAKADWVAIAPWKMSQNAGTSSEAGLEFDTSRRQFPLHNLAGAMFFIAQFWIGMKIVPDGNEVSELRFDVGLDGRHAADGTPRRSAALLPQKMPVTGPSAAVDAFEGASVMPDKPYQLRHRDMKRPRSASNIPGSRLDDIHRL